MTRTAGILSLLTLLFALTGCAVQKPLRFTPKSISRIQYDPRSCTQTPDGRFRCKDVVFTVNSVAVK
jgi:predicted small lipoprotein YifL